MSMHEGGARLSKHPKISGSVRVEIISRRRRGLVDSMEGDFYRSATRSVATRCTGSKPI